MNFLEINNIGNDFYSQLGYFSYDELDMLMDSGIIISNSSLELNRPNFYNYVYRIIGNDKISIVKTNDDYFYICKYLEKKNNMLMFFHFIKGYDMVLYKTSCIFYRCDQLDGLINCLNKIKFS